MSDTKKEAAPAASKPKGKDAPVGKQVSKKAAKQPPKDPKAATKVKKTRRGGVGKRTKKARSLRKAQKIEEGKKKRPAPAESGDAPPAKKPRRPHREIAAGIMKFSRPMRNRKRGTWKYAGKRVRKPAPKKPKTIKKEIGGEKNGGFRIVLVKKRRNNYPTSDPIRKRPARGLFKKHKRYTRKSLTPGTVCILLAGIHKGKRVVLLKVLKSGLLLVNGPYNLNGCPLRRVNQNYVIATRTKLEISDRSVPAHLNDTYFKRIRPKKSKKEGEDIFSTKKEKYTPSEQRKADQKEMDKLVKDAIQKYGKQHRDEKSLLIKYLKSMFGLKRNQNPHSLKF